MRGHPMNTGSVLVTGAAGFIGARIVEEFAVRGRHVIALVHKKEDAFWQPRVGAGAVSVLKGDITQPALLRERLVTLLREQGRGLDVVVHAAARASDVGRRNLFREVNFEGTRNMARIGLAAGARRFVYISTTDVYGLRDFNGERETELALAMTVRNPYPEYKIQAEQWLRENLAPEQWTVLRPAQVWGAGDTTLTPRILGFLRVSPFIVHFGKWRGRNRWPLAHVRNVAAAAFLAAADARAGGQAYTVADSEHTSIDEFYRLLAAAYLPGKRFRTLVLPRWSGLAFGWVVSTLSNLLNLDTPFADPSLYAVYSVSCNLDFSNERLLELYARAGCRLVTRAEGLDELRRARG